MHPSHPSLGPDAGPYEIVRSIARGGMGEVFLAKLRRPGGFEKLVAIKRLLPALSMHTAFVEMFEREAHLAAALTHRNIVQIFDFRPAPEGAWLAMEYVRGVDLKAVLDCVGPETLPLGLALEIGLGCCRGLAYAHRARDAHGRALQVVHGDVSPHNILLSFEGDVKLADFGLARALERGQTGQGEVQGKYAYMSPEQSQGRAAGPQSDLFSLGVVLYEILSGRRAFFADDGVEAILARVQSASPLEPLRHAAPSLAGAAPGVVELIEQAMARDPASRHVDAAALEAELQRAAAKAGIVAGQPPLGPWLAERFPHRAGNSHVESISSDGAPALHEQTAVADAPIVTPTPERTASAQMAPRLGFEPAPALSSAAPITTSAAPSPSDSTSAPNMSNPDSASAAREPTTAALAPANEQPTPISQAPADVPPTVEPAALASIPGTDALREVAAPPTIDPAALASIPGTDALREIAAPPTVEPAALASIPDPEALREVAAPPTIDPAALASIRVPDALREIAAPTSSAPEESSAPATPPVKPQATPRARPFLRSGFAIGVAALLLGVAALGSWRVWRSDGVPQAAEIQRAEPGQTTGQTTGMASTPPEGVGSSPFASVSTPATTSPPVPVVDAAVSTTGAAPTDAGARQMPLRGGPSADLARAAATGPEPGMRPRRAAGQRPRKIALRPNRPRPDDRPTTRLAPTPTTASAAPTPATASAALRPAEPAAPPLPEPLAPSHAPASAPRPLPSAPASPAPTVALAPAGSRVRLSTSQGRIRGRGGGALKGWQSVGTDGLFVSVVGGPGPPVRLRLRRRHGRIYANVDARPWGKVYLDGRPMGDTPAASLPLGAGTRRIRVVGPEESSTDLRIEVDP